MSRLKEYILVDSQSVFVEAHINNEGAWESKQYNSNPEVLLIQALQVEMPLADIYEGTKLLDIL